MPKQKCAKLSLFGLVSLVSFQSKCVVVYSKTQEAHSHSTLLQIVGETSNDDIAHPVLSGAGQENSPSGLVIAIFAEVLYIKTDLKPARARP